MFTTLADMLSTLAIWMAILGLMCGQRGTLLNPSHAAVRWFKYQVMCLATSVIVGVGGLVCAIIHFVQNLTK